MPTMMQSICIFDVKIYKCLRSNFECILTLTLKPFEMKKFLPLMFAGILAVSAYPAQITDYCGEFQCNYIDEFNNPKMLPVTIKQSSTEGKISITGLYAPATIGATTVEADIDLEAGTISIPFTYMGTYSPDLFLFHGIWEGGYYGNYSKDPIVANLVDGKIIFNENDIIVFGVYDENPENCDVYSTLRKVRLSPGEPGLEFQYNEDEWTHIGTAVYPDCCFGYKIFNKYEPITSTVSVVQNKLNPYKIALLNPYDTNIWKSVNRDQESIGQIVIDLTNHDFVIFEPYVYSGFTYNLDGLNLGRCYVYNMEGYFTRIGGLTIEETRQRFISAGFEPNFSSFDGNQIICAYGNVIFATEKKPTEQYSFGNDQEVSIVFDQAAVDVLATTVGVKQLNTTDEAPTEYYDLMGNKVNNPQPGSLYICKKGDSAKKVIF